MKPIVHNQPLLELNKNEATEHVEMALWECGLEPEMDTGTFSDGDIDVVFSTTEFELVIFKGSLRTTIPLVVEVETAEHDSDGYSVSTECVLLSRENIGSLIDIHRKLIGGLL